MVREDKNDEVNLTEVLFRIWAYKHVFFALLLVSSISSILYINSKEKIYTSFGIFIPEKNENSTRFPNISISEFGKIGELAGFNSDSPIDGLIERFSGREFILELADDLNLWNDKFINSYNPDAAGPIWKAKLKSLLNWESYPSEPTRIAEWTIVKNFQKHTKMEQTKGDAIKITVEHVSAERAAEITNNVMNKIISVLKSEKIKRGNERINYLSENLAEALINFENAKEKLKIFMLSYGADASSSFLKGSLMLDSLRKQLEDGKGYVKVIDVLLFYARTASPTFQDYLKLRKQLPTLDQSEFRRILGVSDVINAWNWPSVDTLTRVRTSLVDRSNSLEAEIRKYETDATKYAINAEEHSRLSRELKVAEAVYMVLVEQSKTQSLSAGFVPDTSQIISSGGIAIAPDKPNKKLILAVGTILGFLASALIALLLSWKKGVIYSTGSLLEAINPNLHHKIGSLRYYRSNNLRGAEQCLTRRPAQWLKQLCYETIAHQKTPIVIIADTTHLNNASIIARLVAVSANEFGKSLAYLDLSKTLQFQYTEQTKKGPNAKTEIEAIEIINGCTEYNYQSGKRNLDWLFSKSFQETLDFLYKRHGIILLSVNSDDLDSLLSSERFNKEKIIIHAKKGKTKYEKIRKLNKYGNAEIALLS